MNKKRPDGNADIKVLRRAVATTGDAEMGPEREGTPEFNASVCAARCRFAPTDAPLHRHQLPSLPPRNTCVISHSVDRYDYFLRVGRVLLLKVIRACRNKMPIMMRGQRYMIHAKQCQKTFFLLEYLGTFRNISGLLPTMTLIYKMYSL